MSTLTTTDVLDPARLATRAGTTLGRPAATPVQPTVNEFDADDDEPNDVRTDRVIAENRAKTPKAVSDLRAMPRLSIREINELDSEEIHRRLAKIRRDDRSPTEQVLDLIDLPRNLVMNVAAPGLARKARESGNTGTFGLGRVYASDALEAMGVENRIVRGVVGFAGDVLLDPLTYVGPAGWGAQVGRASVRAGGKRAIRKGVIEAAAGRAVGGEVGAYLKAKGLARQAGEDVAAAHDRISRAVYGDIAENKVHKAFLPFGADRVYSGGSFSDDLFKAVDDEASKAAKAVYAKYGRGSRGIQFGGSGLGGSEIAHLPFTDISLRVKPFTNEARVATETHRLARARDVLSEDQANLYRNAGVASQILREGQHLDDLREDGVAGINRLDELDAKIAATKPPTDDDGLPPMAGSPDDVPPAPTDDGLDMSPDAMAERSAQELRAALDDSARARLEFERESFVQEHSARQKAIVDAFQQTHDEATAALKTALESFPEQGAGPGHELVLHELYRQSLANVDRAYALSHQAAMAKTLRAMDVDTADAIEQLKLVGNEDIAEDLWTIAQKDPALADNLVDMMQKSVATAAEQTEIYRSALSNTLTHPESVLIERTKQMLGVGDAWVAASLLAPVGKLLAGQLEDDSAVVQTMERIDRGFRNTTGIRGGTLSRFLARKKSDIRHAGEELRRVDYAVKRRVAKALGAAGKDTADNRATMLQLAWAKAHPEKAYFRWQWGPEGPKLAADGSFANPTSLVKKIVDARNNGLLSDATIAQEIDALAAEFGADMRRFGRVELQEGTLGVMRPDYLPISLSDPTRDASRTRAAAFGQLGEGGDGFRAEQSFQHELMTLQTRFVAPGSTGEWQRFFKGDRYMLEGFEELPAAERIAQATKAMEMDVSRSFANNPAFAQKRMAEKADAIRAMVEYDEALKADPGFAKKFPTLPTDGLELNELFADGRFHYLVGRDRGIENFVDTDLAAVWANRTMQHHLARTVKQFEDFLGNSLIADPKLLGANMNDYAESASSFVGPPGQAPKTAAGLDLKVLPPMKGRAGNATFTAMINGELYRQLDKEIRTSAASHPLLKSMFGDASNAMDGRLFPAFVADAVEDFVQALRPDKMQEMLGLIDTFQGFWKMYTLTHVSWPIFNFVGGVTLMLMGKGNPATITRNAGPLTRMRSLFNNPKALQEFAMTIRGQRVTGDELLRQAIEYGIAKNNLSLDSVLQYAKDDPGILAATDRVTRRVLAPWFAANQFSEDVMRLSLWVSHMEDGADPAAAAAKTLEAMFDYSDFTHVEERIFRRIFPFYSWIRSNLGYQLKSLVEQPKWAALAPKLQEAIEEAINGDDRVPENLRPRYMRDALATQLNSDPKQRIGLMLGQNIMPQSDLLNVLAPVFGMDGARKFMHFFVNSASPIFSSTVEMATGRELFSGREIGGDVGWSGFAASKIRPIGEFGAVGTAGGIGGALAGGALGALAGPVGAVAGNIAGGLLGSQGVAIATGAIAGNESDTTRFLGGKVGVTAGRGSIGQAMARANLGGRVQAMDDDRLASSVRREFKDKERRLRSRIGSLSRTNQSTTDAMADLLALYRDAVRDGMEDVVPKWAKADLAKSGGAAAGAVTAAN